MSYMSNFNKVKAFMNTYGQDVNEKASFPEDTIVQLRVYLIEAVSYTHLTLPTKA